MPKILIIMSYLILICVIINLAGLVRAEDQRLVINVDQVTAPLEEKLVTVPVWLSHPSDTIAGVDLYVRIPENNRILFTYNEVDQNGLWPVIDTAGTMISGWEWIGISSKEGSNFDLKISALADWPDKTETFPAMPAEKDLLVKLILRQQIDYPLAIDSIFLIMIDTKGSGFSDPHGNSIGVVTTVERECQEYHGDSCLVWKNVRRGYLDTNVVRFSNGSVTIIDTLGSHK